MNNMRLARSTQWRWEQDASLRFSRIDDSPSAAALFAQAFTGKHWTEVPAANLDEADWLHHLTLLAAREPFYNLEMALPLQAERPLWVTLSGAPVFDGRGKFQGYRGVGKDISAQKAAEETMTRLGIPLDDRQDTQHTMGTTTPAVLHQPALFANAFALAIRLNQLRVFYQPIVDLQRQVIGYEALVRWAHPQLGLLGPDQFIALAEQTGLVVPMGEWVLATACRQLAVFGADPLRAGLTIAVNLSARQLAQPKLVGTVLTILQNSGASARQLKLEITESMLLTEIGKTTQTLHALTALGIRLSLDDFGTGYSSLSYLKKLPLSQLKIDQSFVRELLSDPVDAAIVKTILQLARSLGMTVIAEGVELEGQCKVLADMGCREFQGFLFGKPKPFD
jgi:EAL domain-containing protein (putative c-di-GMP-specific phosphodiesterase class I)